MPQIIRLNRAQLSRSVLLFGLALSLLNLNFSPATSAATTPQAADCQQGIGGRLFSNGGQLEVEILPSDAGFTIELHLVSPGPDRFIATNREPGSITRLGTFPAGTELIFGVYVRETQKTFVMGPGSGNP